MCTFLLLTTCFGNIQVLEGATQLASLHGCDAMLCTGLMDALDGAT